jgi:hypothetical protein
MHDRIMSVMAVLQQLLGRQSTHEMRSLNKEDCENQPHGYTNAED